VKIALMDSGIGLLAAAAALRRLRPDADLVLSSAPASMPWGPRTPQYVTEHALACANAAAAENPDALIVACNTASVHALPALRQHLEPQIPVIGTVPATTGSDYQRALIADFADGVRVTEVACPGLADALQKADEDAIDAAVAAAARRTPGDVRSVVLGCTHYELVTDRIRAAVQPTGGPEVVMYGSADAVAAQALRRIGVTPAPDAEPTGGLTVILNGRPEPLEAAALAYAEGRALAGAAATH
jgi:glutamate racemase